MPQPDWDSYANLENLRPVLDPNDSAGFKNALIDRIHWNVIKSKLTGSKRLLDFGCGVGRFTTRIVGLDIEYSGIDISVNMIKAAQKLHKARASSFESFDGVHIPFLDRSFDTFFSCGVFQYILGGPDCDKTFDEIRRVLKPNGRLLLLEQASLSGQTSGTVSRVSTESDYRKELLKYFRVKSIVKVRSGTLSRFSYQTFYVARFLPKLFFTLINFFASMESARVQRASNAHLQAIQYYDILIEAEVHS